MPSIILGDGIHFVKKFTNSILYIIWQTYIKYRKYQKGWYWLIPLLPVDMGVTRSEMVFRKFHRKGNFWHDFCNEVGKVGSRGKCTKVKGSTQHTVSMMKGQVRGWCGETMDYREGNNPIRKTHEWLCKGLVGKKTNQPFWWWECNFFQNCGRWLEWAEARS